MLGDLLVLYEGDRIAAAARLLQGSLEVDESLLTGEAVPVAKSPAIPDVSASTVAPLRNLLGLVAPGWDDGAGLLALLTTCWLWLEGLRWVVARRS